MLFVLFLTATLTGVLINIFNGRSLFAYLTGNIVTLSLERLLKFFDFLPDQSSLKKISE